MQPVEIIQGNSPIVLGLPHTGTHIPDEILATLNDTGKILADTDWHVDRLYSGLLPGATMVCANFHRYVIDANRAPSDESLYPGQNTTGLCPTTDFDGRPIYLDGKEPTAQDIEARRLAWHAPYHAALAAELERVKTIHGIAILYDCHSIRSHIPFLFEGKLPDFNIGTNNTTTCDARIEQAVLARAKRASGYTAILNGRFKGGWTTRHYGKPQNNVHAIQMELAQDTHLTTETPPFAYDLQKSDALRAHLAAILSDLQNLAKSLPKTDNNTF
ncbi:N-formylglutamate deformylase [Cohaesibacter celericrescens]|jgi:formiminoglutamase|uniref:N-formylglutamate deformylase n=1 Tax=Cohaesibacter celericrescens TaxID=2067669 RepID=A0A2N5XMC5_9HYPH|nr:N-formylglutamate deformylase [Cohaesibacter celericrescens]PLW75691.1 N-formylglutamate deformylase [Cohaesibacter celericrescens]